MILIILKNQTKFDLILGPSTFDSPSFRYQNGIVLYKDGLFQENKVDMCAFCVKCHHALSKEHIPKFSAANHMWLGDIPAGITRIDNSRRKTNITLSPQ